MRVDPSTSSSEMRSHNERGGRIDGSLYGQMVLSDVRVADPKGVFLTSPRLSVDWRPFAFVDNHVDVRTLSTDLVTLARRPELPPRYMK